MIFFHNITKAIFNISELEELIHQSSPTDLIAYTQSGDATVHLAHGSIKTRIEEAFIIHKKQED